MTNKLMNDKELMDAVKENIDYIKRVLEKDPEIVYRTIDDDIIMESVDEKTLPDVEAVFLFAGLQDDRYIYSVHITRENVSRGLYRLYE